MKLAIVNQSKRRSPPEEEENVYLLCLERYCALGEMLNLGK